jgi:hypothetical protein
VPPGDEQAWADALAREHLHQRELLAALRDELGTFARELSAALTSLDAYIGLAGVNEILTTAQATVSHARLALEIGRRLEGADDPYLLDLYTVVAGDEDVPPPLVRHASDLLSSAPKRSDRELLQAVVTASGTRKQIEQLVGPAPAAAFAALRPLVSRIRTGDVPTGDLEQVLTATAELDPGDSAATALTLSLRDAVDSTERAVKAVRDGGLSQALAEARERLEQDLDALRAIHEGADEAPAEWRAARKAEHAELAEEVRVKLDKIERIRGVLLGLPPQLHAVTRALGVVQRLHELEGRLEPEPASGAAAAHAALAVAANELWQGSLPEPAPAPRARRVSKTVRYAVLAVAVLAGVGVGVALAGGSSKPKPVVMETNAAAPTTTAATAIGARPSILPVNAFFDPSQRATFYTVAVEHDGEPAIDYRWALTPPADNPTCNRFEPIPAKPNEAVWHHADTDGCTHNGIQHAGTVHVTVITAHWSCRESFFGTLTRTGTPNAQCTRY